MEFWGQSLQPPDAIGALPPGFWTIFVVFLIKIPHFEAILAGISI